MLGVLLAHRAESRADELPRYNDSDRDDEDQSNMGFPHAASTLYRRNQVCCDNGDDRCQQGVYENLLQPPRSA